MTEPARIRCFDRLEPGHATRRSINRSSDPGIVPLLALLLVLEACVGAPDAHNPDAGATTPPDRGGIALELMAADSAFASATSEQGLDGWMAFFAEDAIRFDNEDRPVQGRGFIRSLDSTFMSDPTRLLRWAPFDAGSFEDGNLGYTRGRYAVTTRPSGDTLGTGSYLSLWRREPDGWRVIFDSGNPDPPARD